jgi:AmiR/NasT family two-component response regulator
MRAGRRDNDDLALAQAFANYAGVAIANAHLYTATATQARQLEEAMASRAVIEQAKGLIMAQRRCTPDEAFQTLSRASQRSNRKLRDIATAIVTAAQRP